MKKYLFSILMPACTLVYGQNTCDTLGVNVLKGVQYNTVPATVTGVIKVYDTLEFRDGTKQYTAGGSGTFTDYRDGEITVSGTTTFVTFSTPFPCCIDYDIYYTELDAVGIDTKATSLTKTGNGFTLITLSAAGRITYYAVKRK